MQISMNIATYVPIGSGILSTGDIYNGDLRQKIADKKAEIGLDNTAVYAELAKTALKQIQPENPTNNSDAPNEAGKSSINKDGQYDSSNSVDSLEARIEKKEKQSEKLLDNLMEQLLTNRLGSKKDDEDNLDKKTDGVDNAADMENHNPSQNSQLNAVSGYSEKAVSSLLPSVNRQEFLANQYKLIDLGSVKSKFETRV